MIYHLYPKMRAIVHSHSTLASSFTATKKQIPIRPVLNEAYFLGTTEPPIFQWLNPLQREETAGTPRSLHSNIAQYMATLFLHPEARETVLQKINEPHPTSMSYHTRRELLTINPVVLVQGEGFFCTAKTLEEVVSRAVYTQKNFVALKDAIALAGGDHTRVKFLSKQECKAAARYLSQLNLSRSRERFLAWKAAVSALPDLWGPFSVATVVFHLRLQQEIGSSRVSSSWLPNFTAPLTPYGHEAELGSSIETLEQYPKSEPEDWSETLQENVYELGAEALGGPSVARQPDILPAAKSLSSTWMTATDSLDGLGQRNRQPDGLPNGYPHDISTSGLTMNEENVRILDTMEVSRLPSRLADRVSVRRLIDWSRKRILSRIQRVWN
ncbi:uncharacterized protein EI97DRAFT_133978 [Westerdykella ornata]|uniref:Class II aldolase/adducin N-terminal domain-containing protein n=1 Tax=Westerdykella ornata TaxID=318751 RepID=A0A6A6JBR7_WESOR|nr:uncharacterized protein EI97DRAFT_133978 [Westerdykella ornata]KAF2274021.1 hypothetical protein EI97DRAFT_133978 [Westerdykella ornata]